MTIVLLTIVAGGIAGLLVVSIFPEWNIYQQTFLMVLSAGIYNNLILILKLRKSYDNCNEKKEE